MSTEREITMALSAARLSTTADLDRRVLEDAGRALVAPRPFRGPSFVRLFAYAAAAVVAAMFGAALWGPARTSPDGAGESLAEGASGVTSNGHVALGWPRTVGARELAADVPWILVVRPTGAEDLTVQAEVLDVLKGERALLGRRLDVRGQDLGASLNLGIGQRSVLCIAPLHAFVPAEPGTESTVLVALAPDGPVPVAGPIAAHTPYGDQVPLGVRVLYEPPPSGPAGSPELVVGRLMALLANALMGGDAETRYGAITALRRWDGQRAGEGIELWQNRDLRGLLLSAGEDPDPRVRWTVTWMVPDDGRPATEALLLKRLFDPDRMVRQPAAAKLEERGRADLVAPWNEVADYLLDELSSVVLGGGDLAGLDRKGAVADQIRWLSEHEQWESRMRSAWTLGHVAPTADVTGALLAALSGDAHPEVRRWAAWALGRHAVQGDAVVEEALRAVAVDPDEDGRVQVRAAEALVARGRLELGVELLQRLGDAEDPRTAAQAVEVMGDLGNLRREIFLQLLLAKTQDSRAVVRGTAVTELGWQLQRGVPGDYVEKIRRVFEILATDDSAYVREAARVARVAYGSVRRR